MTLEEVASAVAVGELISRELDEDYVGIWVIVWHLRRKLEHVSGQKVRELAEAILLGLAGSDVCVGRLSEGSGIFTPWPGRAGVERAVRAWKDLGRDPTIGEIAWIARLR